MIVCQVEFELTTSWLQIAIVETPNTKKVFHPHCVLRLGEIGKVCNFLVRHQPSLIKGSNIAPVQLDITTTTI